MVRYVVTMTDGIRWELSARDSVDAAQRAERSHGGAPAAVPGARAQIVQTLEQYAESERARFVAEMAELGAEVVGYV
jgi:hypothetical protein